jgi:glycosyltransferase involved in cell wall biosynthesis
MENKSGNSIAIIIPTYNEEVGLKGLLEEIDKSDLADKYEVIVVNDGSTDNTEQIVRKFSGMKVLSHRLNKGYGAALKTGIRNTKADKIIVMDSDGQHSIEYIEQFVEKLQVFPLVIGQRTEDSYEVRKRTLGKKFIRLIAEYLIEQKLPDYNSGFRGFDRRLMKSMLHIMPNGYSFSTTCTLAFLKKGYDFTTVPIKVIERAGGKSRVKFFKDGAKTLLLAMRVIMLFNPLKIFFPASLFVFLLGVIWGLYGFAAFKRVPNSAVFVLILGVFLFLIGLLADQISMLNLSEKTAGDDED